MMSTCSGHKGKGSISVASGCFEKAPDCDAAVLMIERVEQVAIEGAMDGVESLAARTNAGYDVGEKGSVWHCRFHPTKAKLACALDGGRVCVFSAPPVLAVRAGVRATRPSYGRSFIR